MKTGLQLVGLLVACLVAVVGLLVSGCATARPAGAENPAVVRETAVKLPHTHVAEDGTVSSDLRLCTSVPVVKP